MLTTICVAVSTKRWLRAWLASSLWSCLISTSRQAVKAAMTTSVAASAIDPTRTRCAGRRGGGLTGLRPLTAPPAAGDLDAFGDLPVLDVLAVLDVLDGVGSAGASRVTVAASAEVSAFAGRAAREARRRRRCTDGCAPLSAETTTSALDQA